MSPLDVAIFAVDYAAARHVRTLPDTAARLRWLRRVSAEVDQLHAAGDVAGLRTLCVSIPCGDCPVCGDAECECAADDDGEDGANFGDAVDYFYELEVSA